MKHEKKDKLTKKSGKKRMWMIALAAAAALLLAAAAMNAAVCFSAREKIMGVSEIGETFDAVLVLGAGVREDNTPSLMLQERLLTALEAYEKGVSEKILLSGDRTGDYDEVGVMKNYLSERGVPEDAMILDPEGFSTYASVWRAKEVFRMDSLLIVTQKYHAYRAQYIADRFGIRAKTLPAAERFRYHKNLWYDLRECVARCKDFVWCVLKPDP